MAKLWKKGRGKLGPLSPLHGTWVAEGDSEMGVYRCTRTFQPVLEGSYLQLDVRWAFGPDGNGRTYEERAIIGPDESGALSFWSFTSDGKRSHGTLADATDIHPEAIGFEAQMPAGLARQAYWPATDGGFHLAVESKSKKGWKRFVEHRYRRIGEK